MFSPIILLCNLAVTPALEACQSLSTNKVYSTKYTDIYLINHIPNFTLKTIENI